MNDPPRSHHFEFAHRVLPALALRDPQRFMAMMAGEDAKAILEELWTGTGREVWETERAPVLPSTGLDARILKLDEERLVALIVLPNPIGTTECHFVAFVTSIASSGAGLSCFTLEVGANFDGEECTTLGSWVDRMHLNHGTGPAPEPVAFLEAIKDFLEGRSAVDISPETQARLQQALDAAYERED
ncbi:MAG TPA: hypothetical protein VFQ05_05380 [Candidatus Eisenbacteria bacterium]|nr:hypothetical protein [Candidatus Eisenbacteria bacterium]